MQQPAYQHQRRGEQANGFVSGHQHNQYRAAGHDRQGDDQTFAPADVIDVCAEHDGAQRPHQEACAEYCESHHQGGELAARREKHSRDLRGVEAEQKEVELFEKVARGHPEDGTGPRAVGRD